jgi:hypothetical protein
MEKWIYHQVEKIHKRGGEIRNVSACENIQIGYS